MCDARSIREPPHSVPPCKWTTLFCRSGVSRCPASPSMQRRITCLSCCWIHFPCEECTFHVVLNTEWQKGKETIQKKIHDISTKDLNPPKQGNSKLRLNTQDQHCLFSGADVILTHQDFFFTWCFLGLSFLTLSNLVITWGEMIPIPSGCPLLFSLLGLVFGRIFTTQLQTEGFVCFNFAWKLIFFI